MSSLPLAHPAAACARGSHRYCGRAPLPRAAAVAFTGGRPPYVSPPLVGGRTAAAYARLLLAHGCRLSVASARRLPLPPSRDLLLVRDRVVRLLSARGRHSVAVLP
ncbi:hypothetical protein GW17_00008779 [Ensete ventricosum]|nr:hypothetical protein GW17_00008779 [Ensete ventricosum]